MGDSEERTAYTPEEQSEIDRILGLLPGESSGRDAGEEPQPAPARTRAVVEDEDAFDLSSDLVEIDEAPPPSSDEIEDITDIIEMVEEPSAGEVPDLGELSFEEAPAAEAPPEMEAPPEEALPAFEEEVAPPPLRPGRKARTSLEELDELTSMEPESVDLQDVSDDRYVDEAEAPRAPEIEEPVGAEESIEPIDMDLAELEEPAPRPSGMRLEKETDIDIGTLSDISVEEIQDIPDAGVADIPEFDLGDIAPESEMPPSPPPAREGPAADFMEDFHDEGIPEPLDMDEGPLPSRGSASDLDIGIKQEEMIPGIGRIEEAVSTEEIPDVEEEEPPPEPPKKKKERIEAAPEEGDELSERDIRRLKKALLLFHPALRKAVKDAILNDLLPPADSRQLIDMILSGKPEDNVHRFLEKKLGRSIDISEGPAPGRRVLTSRPEYTREGLERQKRLLKATRIGGIAALAAFTVTILSYQFIYKPMKARKLIKEGVALIREQGDPVTKKVKDFEKAEELFARVDADYAKDYLPGYNAYARAYFDKHEYERALGKLERANKIDPVDIDTLNNLGYFYSRVPESVYNRIKRADEKDTRIDKAIKYYNYVLNRKPKNVTALYGIGNAFMYQGKYIKARQYYEDILKIDRKSVVGYSGLLNLYIERDVMPRVMAIHSDLADKKMLADIPSPLLGKLAAYYIGKKRTDSTNIRVDFGVQSSRFKDPADNPFPAARAVLDVLHKRDPHYPQQYVLYAKLSREDKNNLKLMENYLQKALKEEPNYFAALHLLGEYYYAVKEPGKAFDAFKRAVKASLSPPDFTYEDFYFETENVGNTYFHMGNIFYYFFDRVKYRFGDELEERALDAEVEQQANYIIAREKYEAALKEGFRSPELFYNIGRIHYMNGQYERALERWLELYEESVDSPEVMLAMGNAFYHLDNLEAGRGEYLKLISIFERRAESITKIFPDRADHVKVFQTLATAYNNLGAVYQRKNDETRSNVSYWKAIDYAKRIDRENEFARVNMARAFKERSEPIRPILDENIPFALSAYSKDMR